MPKFALICVCSLLVLVNSEIRGDDPGSVSIGSAIKFGRVDTKGLATLIASEVPLVILDARSFKWDDGLRIASAQALFYTATAEQAAAAIPSLDSLVVVYCTNSHCPASMYLAARLSELGYSNILEYEEGIEEWIHSGYPVRETRHTGIE